MDLFVAPSRGRGLPSFRALLSLLDIGKDLAPVLQIGVVISRPSDHVLKNMSDLDLSHAIRREGDNREGDTLGTRCVDKHPISPRRLRSEFDETRTALTT
jgi:hypothetical protein